MKLYGRNPVLERLKTNPKSILRLFITPKHEESAYLLRKAKKWRIPVAIVPPSKIQKMARNLNAQGLLAEVEAFAYRSYDELLDLALGKSVTPVFLDGLNDPQNLGGILRSLACLGPFSLVLPTHHSVEVTESVLRVASGGDNFVPVAKVSNLNQAIKTARDRGIWMAGAVVSGGQDIRTTKFIFPMGLVIGSEHKGIRDVIRRQLDAELTLPMAHPRLSMNAAHAATLFGYEIIRQRACSLRGEE